MPATTSVTPSGIPNVDYVDSGTKWAVSNFTYSFPTSGSFYVGLNGAPYGSGEANNGFKAFTPIQQAATASILNLYSAVANVTFTQIAETSTQSAVLRYAESNTPSTAWAYLPSPLPEGGDAWFNNSTHWYDTPGVGNYAWLTIIHETGHLLGLKHPQEAIGQFGAVPASVDSLEYTVMSYRSYIGASTTQGLTNATWSFPTTLMVYDIAALQYMYGANYTTNNGDTVYRWNPATGQETINGVAQAASGGNTIFMTLWDGGGIDTYDFSNYTTSLSVNLQPGNWTTVSSTQLANLGGGHTAIGNIANAYLYNNNPASLIENAIGGSGNDTIAGNATNNRLTGGAGNDTLDGVTGTSDVAVYSGSSTSYQVTQNSDGSWRVADLRSGSPDGADTLRNIEFLQFSDRMVAVGPIQPVTIVESNGSTSLTEIGNHFYLYNSAGVGPSLKFQGADVMAGQWGASVVPISAEITATGYEVAWKVLGTNQYSVWATDSNGNYTSNIIGTAAGTDPTLESIETSFHQDLNGDGVIGIPAAAPSLSASGGPTTLIGGPGDVPIGGAAVDTFVFKTNFGAQTVSNFASDTDALAFHQSMFESADAVSNENQQIGLEVLITHDSLDVTTLHSVQPADLHVSIFHVL